MKRVTIRVPATTANRMSRHRFRNAVTAEDVAELFQKNQEEKA